MSFTKQEKKAFVLGGIVSAAVAMVAMFATGYVPYSFRVNYIPFPFPFYAPPLLAMYVLYIILLRLQKLPMEFGAILAGPVLATIAFLIMYAMSCPDC